MIFTPHWTPWHFGFGASIRIRDPRTGRYARTRYIDVFLRFAWLDLTFTFAVGD